MVLGWLAQKEAGRTGGLEDCVAWGVMVDMLEGIWMVLTVVEHWTRVEVPMETRLQR